MTRFCVIYTKDGRECQSPWIANRARAVNALDVLRRRYGAAVLYID